MTEGAVRTFRLAGTSIRRFSELQPELWKNGLGQTREVCRGPAGADGSDFMWRLSIADITGDSAFSRFPGINRSFLLATGRSFRLTTDGSVQTLEAGTVVQFPGEADVSVEVAAEPAVAVNLLTRRGKCLGEIIVKSVHRLLRMDDASVVAAVVLDGSAATSDGGQLGALDVVLPGPGAAALTCTNAVVALIRVKSQTAV